MEVEAVNSSGAKVGDLVLISFGNAPLVKVYALVYIFPILALLAGAILGQRLSAYVPMDESLSALILGFLFFGGAFFIVKFWSSRMARKDDYQPVVLRVLSEVKCPSA
jgi:sigma-E factor negative regulatory protein RseC